VREAAVRCSLLVSEGFTYASTENTCAIAMLLSCNRLWAIHPYPPKTLFRNIPRVIQGASLGRTTVRILLAPDVLFDDQLIAGTNHEFFGPYSELNWKICCTARSRHTKPRTNECPPGP
jgi:hypothetical protein